MKTDLSKIDWSLYAILDKKLIGARNLKRLAEQVIAGGAGIIQLRNKISSAIEFYNDALEVKNITAHFQIPLIINDRVDVALAVGAEGVHLGQDDVPFDAARRLLGSSRILGASVHSLVEFQAAQAGQPDYLGVGTIYPSPTKDALPEKGVELIRELRRRTNVPMVGIGGITVENAGAVIEAGADGVAVISDLLNAENVREHARQFVTKIHDLKQSLREHKSYLRSGSVSENEPEQTH